jgi:triphosphoribosyl-dephospho-CoA synthase
MSGLDEDFLKLSPRGVEVTHNLTLACLLEASAPKPGNVSPIHAFHNTRYEHYLAGSVAVGLTLGVLAEPGIDLSIGKAVYDAVERITKAHSGGNTHLGIIILLAPLARALEVDVETPVELRNNLGKVLEGMDFHDTIWYYKAVNLAKPKGLLPVKKYDVFDKSTQKKVEEDKVSIKQWMDVGKGYNSISYEYVTDYELTFELGLPYITSLRASDEPINLDELVLMLYLKFLSEHLDSLVIGKFDEETAKMVTEDAKKILALHESRDPHAQAATLEFQEKLNAKSINPGTTADLTAAALFVALMMGLKL